MVTILNPHIPRIEVGTKRTDRIVFKKRCNQIIRYLYNKSLTTKELSEYLKTSRFNIRQSLAYLQYLELVYRFGNNYYLKQELEPEQLTKMEKQKKKYYKKLKEKKK